MQFTNLFDDDRAVSPVIGVILMVAITVILAAVIGTFVLGMSDQMGDNAPRASFGFDYDGTDVTITHESGASIAESDLKVTVAGTEQTITDWSAGDTVSAGDSIAVTASSGQEVRVIYVSPDSGSSTTLQKFQVP